MIRRDPIVEEIHAAREAIARAADFDIDKMIEAARARQAAEGRETVKLSPRRPEPATPATKAS